VIQSHQELDPETLQEDYFSEEAQVQDDKCIMKKTIVVPIVVALVVGGTSFYAGMRYQQTRLFTFSGDRQGNFMMESGGGQRNGGFSREGSQRGMVGQGFRPVIGEIISSDEGSITVKLEDGSSKIVLISDTTAINKTDPGTMTDLKTGTKVGVFGADNNGTITAQNIQINPQQIRVSTPSASSK